MSRCRSQALYAFISHLFACPDVPLPPATPPTNQPGWTTGPLYRIPHAAATAARLPDIRGPFFSNASRPISSLLRGLLAMGYLFQPLCSPRRLFVTTHTLASRGV